jgi:nitroreductase
MININTIIETIKSRRSIRKYLSYQIKQVELNAIIEAEIYAPTGHNEQVLKAAKVVCKEGELIHNLLGDVPVEEVYDAILTADALGEQYLVLENK